MTRENKELLLQDVCARLPHGVKVHAKYIDTDTDTEVEKDGVLCLVDSDMVTAFVCTGTNCYNYVAIHEVKPYLFPLSSMTEEQEMEYDATFATIVYEDGRKDSVMTYKSFDWLIKNNFDFRGLIPMGLAIDATNLNIY